MGVKCGTYAWLTEWYDTAFLVDILLPPADWFENKDPAFDSTDVSSISLKTEDTVNIWAMT